MPEFNKKKTLQINEKLSNGLSKVKGKDEKSLSKLARAIGKFKNDDSPKNSISAKKSRTSMSSDNKDKQNFLLPNCSRVQKTPDNLSCQRSLPSFKSASRSNLFDHISSSFTKSKILSLKVLSNIDTQKRLELSSWGLPALILEKYESRGVKRMFPWQVECLANHKVLQENKNLVYSAPTSAGKTLVSEFLVLKTVLERRKKAIIILPFVSVVREKMFYFQDLLSNSGVRVEGFMGGVAPPGGFSAVHIAIATIEKANSLINRLMEEGNLSSLGAVVVDELHLLGDPNRGYLLELLLTKLRYMTLNVEHVNIQLIGMSATLPNLDALAHWLDAELYKTNFRPIPLQEMCKVGTTLYSKEFKVLRKLAASEDLPNDAENIIQLVIETIEGGHGILIFCPSKSWCEKLSIQIATSFVQLGKSNNSLGQILRKNINLLALEEILEQLKHSPVGLDSILKRTVTVGVAFHHAGLTMDERDIIEGAFRTSTLKVLIATSTLSSGVNLPARRVIVRTPMFGGKPIDTLTYQQMIGRAGRMGKDTAGESIIICKPTERTTAENLMNSTLQPIESCLEGSHPLIRALLEAVASQIVKSPNDLQLYSECTFLYACGDNDVKESVEDAIQYLISNELLSLKVSKDQEKRWMATPLGKACLAASISPKDGLFLFEELQRARKCLVLDTDLHVIYLVTPFNPSQLISQIDWMLYLDLWKIIPESNRRVGHLVGVEERFLMTAARGIVKPGKALNIHRRFFTAMALNDLVHEMPLSAVSRKYECFRGLLQSLQQSSSTFAGMVTNFCRELKWDCMELLFSQFQTRLQFGVRRNLLDLLRLPSLNGLRARSLYNNGIQTVGELAVANEFDVEEALNKALPFESEKDFDGRDEDEIAKKHKMRTVFITGKDGLTAHDAALILIKEARELLKKELGVEVQWNQNNSNQSTNCTVQNASSKTPSEGVSLDSCKKTNVQLPKFQDEKTRKIQDTPETYISGHEQRVSDVINFSGSSDVVNSSDVHTSDSKNSKFKTPQFARPLENKDTNNIVDKDTPTTTNKLTVESFRFSERILNEAVEAVERHVPSPATVVQNGDISGMDKVEKRESTTSNLNNSASLFGDSSYFDSQVCSMLEKNVMDSVLLAEFEKSNFTPDVGVPHKMQNNKVTNHPVVDAKPDENCKRPSTPKKQSTPTTWADDSWDDSKNLVRHPKSDEESPLLLMTTRSRINNLKKHKESMTLQRKDTPQSSSPTLCQTKAAKTVENLIDKDRLQIRAFKASEDLFTTDSDSDNSIVSSQKLDARPTMNKTRTRIENKLKTQKTCKQNEICKQFESVKISNTDSSTDDSFVFDSKNELEILSKNNEATPKDKINNIIKARHAALHSAKGTDKIMDTYFSKPVEPLNVTDSRQNFNRFIQDIGDKNEVAVTIVSEHFTEKNYSTTIGNKIIGAGTNTNKAKDYFIHGEKKILGFIFSCGASQAYHFSLSNSKDNKISIQDRISFLKNLFTNSSVRMKCCDAKEIFKVLYQCLEIQATCKFIDPKIGDWLLNSEHYERSLNDLVEEYYPKAREITKYLKTTYGTTTPGVIIKRFCAQCLLIWYLADVMVKVLRKHSNILESVYDIEMEVVIILAKMELRGFGINYDAMNELSTVIKNDLDSIEQEAFKLAGRRFNFCSTKEVSLVLGLAKKGRACTNKAALKNCENPISNLVTLWRKLNAVQTKIIIPLLNLASKSDRIHGNCIIYSVTGRVSMHEPNLQTIPRDFESEISNCVISARMAFVPAEGNIILTADYCQLELRILAHFSKDPILCKILKQEGDVFKTMAALMYKTSEDLITDDMRQTAKGLCYAMIYGMGTRSLAESLSVSESEAKDYLESFMNTYKGIRPWIASAIEETRLQGFVRTIGDRRRVLPAIESATASIKAQAERQAINTKIQGSGADITKKAMVLIEDQLKMKFKNSTLDLSKMQRRRNLRSNNVAHRGAFLILQLHDELIYEVNAHDLEVVALMVKESMEGAYKLQVPLPVKIKIGPQWGVLTEYKV